VQHASHQHGVVGVVEVEHGEGAGVHGGVRAGRPRQYPDLDVRQRGQHQPRAADNGSQNQEHRA